MPAVALDATIRSAFFLSDGREGRQKHRRRSKQYEFSHLEVSVALAGATLRKFFAAALSA
jgi:hypothetical protein